MLFNSIDFAVFLPIVFLLYWFVAQKNLKHQNLLIVGASYVFYGWWDWRFLSLIIFSTAVDFSLGLALEAENNDKKRRFYLWTSLIVNLGLLGFFKYANFFIDNLSAAFSIFGVPLSLGSLKILLPIGISFYTFQTLSYTIDVYRRKLRPTRDFVAFSAFVSFFPQLVAGPIERATNLLPQFQRKREFDYESATDGLRQILWGFVKKMLIADNCAIYANMFFNSSDDYSGSALLLGAFFFTFQIYGDFSGYSDIAIGTSRLFGFNLLANFKFPYFSRDIAEFWRRWHISLSSWFKDYLYIPLGGSRGGFYLTVRNIFIIFLVSGFWHGANWTFIVWGALNAMYFLPLMIWNKNRVNLDVPAKNRIFPSCKEAVCIALTFGLTMFAWIFFRADSVSQAIGILGEIFSRSLFEIPEFKGTRDAIISLCLISIFVVIEWWGRAGEYAIEDLGKTWPKLIRWGAYLLIILTIYFFGSFSESIEFIYFQF